MAQICVRITEFTDPTCPWAYSAEPFRQRINWLYEGRIEWEPRMVVLAATREEQAEKGFTPEKLAANLKRIAARAPDADRHPRRSPTCRRAATPAGSWSPPGSTPTSSPSAALLRSLRIRNFSGELLDDPQVLRGAAADAEIADDYEAWMADPEVERAARRRRRPRPPADARREGPRPQARQLVGRPPLHLPELRDDPARRRRHDLDPGLSAVLRLRHDPRQPRPRHGPPRAGRIGGAGARVARLPPLHPGGRDRLRDALRTGPRGARADRRPGLRRRRRLLDLDGSR